MVAKTGSKSRAKPAAKAAASRAPKKSTAKPAAKRAGRASAKSTGQPAAKSTRKTSTRTSGIAIPKSARGAANKIAELSRNPLFIEMAAAGIVAAAGVMMRNNKTVRAAAGKVGAGARGAASDTADLATRLGQAVAAAISNMGQRLHGEEDESEPSPPPAPEKRSSRKQAVPLDTKGGRMPYVS
jgi:adenylate kinase